MNIDMAALHAIEVDRGISADELLDTISTALLTAYRHTEGHQPDARINIDRKSGTVKVMAREPDEDGNVVAEWDDTPEGFGRVGGKRLARSQAVRLRDGQRAWVVRPGAARAAVDQQAAQATVAKCARQRHAGFRQGWRAQGRRNRQYRRLCAADRKRPHRRQAGSGQGQGALCG